jgi:DNA-binding PadR family transcriptional regulator
MTRFRIAYPVEMPPVKSDELPATMAALGLVIEQPGETVAHIVQCVVRRFERAQFSSSTAHSAVRNLAKDGRVHCTYVPPGGGDAQSRYEATNEGVEAFSSWKLEMPSGKPSLRDVLYGRIELCKLEDVPQLIKMSRAEEAISTDLYAQANARLKDYLYEKRKWRRRRVRRQESDLLLDVRATLLYADPVHWASRSEQYRVIADRLEEIAEEISDLGLGIAGG